MRRLIPLLACSCACALQHCSPKRRRIDGLRRPAAAEALSAAVSAAAQSGSAAVSAAAQSGSAAGAASLASANAAVLAATGLTLAQTGGLAAAAVAGALAMRLATGRENDALKGERDRAVEKARVAEDRLEEEVFQMDARYESETAGLKKQFDTTLKVRTDVLRGELSREKDAAIATLSEAQEAQLGEMREYYTEQFSTKVSDLQADLDAKQETIDAQAAELERFRRDAGFGDMFGKG